MVVRSLLGLKEERGHYSRDLPEPELQRCTDRAPSVASYVHSEPADGDRHTTVRTEDHEKQCGILDSGFIVDG